MRVRHLEGRHSGHAWHWCLCSVPRLSNGSEWLFHGKDEEELQAWLQGLSAAITECRGSRGKVQSLPLPIPPAPPEAPLPRKDKEKRFSFFPKKK